MEIWKDIPGYEGKYKVSNKGQVKSIERKRKCRVNGGTIATMTVHERILKQWKRSSYLLVDLWNERNRDIRSVHILVFEVFNGKIKDGCFIHHKDENKFNNTVDNLIMMSCLDHNRHHHSGKPSWNKGKKMSPDVHKKAWETRRRREQNGKK